MTSGYVLDTNVVSELARPVPDASVVAFVSALDDIVVPAIVAYELERGVLSLPIGKRRAGLRAWLDAWLVPPVVVAPFDHAAAKAAADIETRAARRGRTVDVRDAFILGTARALSSGVATRNVAHLGGHGVDTLDPFTPASRKP